MPPNVDANWAIPARPHPDWEEIHRELRRPHVTLQLLWQEYKERHPDGFQYSWFAEHYRLWARKLDVVLRQEHRAGEKLFVDFAGRTIPIVDPATGQTSQAPFFVGVLGASNYTYAEATPSQELPHWIAAHVHAFEYIGGVPQIVVPDNPRVGITRAHRYEPELNRTYQEMAAHYRCAIIPARPRKPRDKAKVEAGVLVAERWILASIRNLTFFSLTEANAVIAERLEWLNDRPFKKLPGSRRSLFESLDRPQLAPLPDRPYEFGIWKMAKVSIDYHLEVDGHYYSVPYQLTGERCEVRLGTGTVEIFYRGRRVASHLRSWRAGGFTTDAAHPQRVPGTPSRPAVARIASPPSGVDTQPVDSVGRGDRASHRAAGRRHPAISPSPRAGLSLLPGHLPPGPDLRQRSPRSCLPACPGPASLQLPQRPVHPQDRPRPPAPADTRAGASAPRARQCAWRRLLPMKGDPLMLTTPTIDKLMELKLKGMARALLEQQESTEYHRLSFEDRLGLLVDREKQDRENRRIHRSLGAARLRTSACVEDIDFHHPRGLDRTQILHLAACHWVDSHQQVLIVGPTGAGKTFLACALAQAAIRHGATALYQRAPRMLTELLTARGDGRLPSLMAAWARVGVLVIDDFGLQPLTVQQAADLLEVIEDRVQRRSTIITSQLPLALWHQALGEPTLADAILDRLLHDAHRIELSGESLRKVRRSESEESPMSAQPTARKRSPSGDAAADR